MSKIRNLQVGEQFAFPGGYRKPFGGHVVMHLLIRATENTFDLVTCNSGNGIAYHGSKYTSGEKEKFRTTIRCVKIPVSQFSIALSTSL